MRKRQQYASKIIVLLMCLVASISCSPWNKYSTEKYGKERVLHLSHYKAEFNITTRKPEVKSNQVYFTWFAGDRVHRTQGGYSGLLLHGKYTETFENKNLKQQGKYKLGKRIGVWKSWGEEGQLIRTEEYKKGKRLKTITFEKGLPKDTINYTVDKDKN